MSDVRRPARFGIFEADLRTRELRKRGVKIKLQDQPFEVLALLLERPGEVVTREELQQRLWPTDTYVDFEHGLNGTIKRLRQSLGDSAESPRFIETLPRHGYRFIAPVDLGAGARRSGWTGRGSRLVAVGVAVATLIALGVAGLGVWRDGKDRDHLRVSSIAVLPLENLSGDPGQEYFADGMTEALINGLAQLQNLRVISRTSIMRYKGTRKALPDIAGELGVEAILEGSIVRSGTRVRVTAQLIDAVADRHLWGGSYEREIEDVLEVEADLAGSIATAISIEVTSQDRARLAASRKVDPEAYELFLKGQHYISLWDTGDDFTRGVEHLRQSTDRDPTFAPAWAALATAYGSWGFFSVRPPGQTGERARAAALRALDLDPTLGEAQAALGLAALWHDWDWVGAEQHARRALELSPKSVPALIQANIVLIQLGQLDKAIELNRRALALDPLSTSTSLNLGFTYFCARRYADAIGQLERCRDLDPRSPWPWIEIAWVEARRGRSEAALAAADQARRLLRDDQIDALGILGWVYGVVGSKEDAQGLLRRLVALEAPMWSDPYYEAYLHAGMGDTQAALDDLERAVKLRSPSVVRLLIDPTWDGPIRSLPGYGELCRRIGMPEPLILRATGGARD